MILLLIIAFLFGIVIGFIFAIYFQYSNSNNQMLSTETIDSIFQDINIIKDQITNINREVHKINVSYQHYDVKV
jgi:uncharacterized membrane-anchored protein YhcB (DUF1043 family)